MKKFFLRWKKNDANLIYLMHFLYRFAMATIGIFIPIYLLKLGYSLTEVFWFLIIASASIAVFSFFAAVVADKIGLKKTIILRTPFIFIFTGMLYALDRYDFPLFLIGSISGFIAAFYWVPLHILFIRMLKVGKTGSGAGKLTAYDKLAGILAPIFGAFIVTLLSFKVLFILVSLIILFSVFPLLLFKSTDDTIKFEVSRIFEIFKKEKEYFISNPFKFIGQETEKNIWPIFVYLNLINIMSVGVVGSLFALGSVLFSFFVGNLSDKVSKSKLLFLGSFCMAIAFFSRYFFDSELFYYIISILSGFLMILIIVSARSVLYGSAKKNTIDEFFVTNEIFVAIGRIMLYGFAFLVIDRLEMIFLMAGVSFLIFPFVIRGSIRRLEGA